MEGSELSLWRIVELPSHSFRLVIRPTAGRLWVVEVGVVVVVVIVVLAFQSINQSMS